MWKKKDLIGIEELSKEEIELIVKTAVNMKDILKRPIKKVPTLRGRTICTLFYEPSTRTRSSFELAAKYLSADTISIATSTSSVQKGETLLDTVKTLEAMGIDLFIIRHSASGVPSFIAKNVRAGVINAGDGMHEHPTQALLDVFSVYEKKGRLDGLKIAIIGDIFHSRVARSNIYAWNKLGSEVIVCGPPTLIPPYIESLNVKVTYNLDEAIEDADVIYVLRLQLERQKKGLFPTLREYHMLYGVNSERIEKAKKDVLVMHPGPMNRGVEISSEVADSLISVINEQVTNGVAVRMALLYLMLGGKGDEDTV
ncbi:MAG: aspartate carbamoyltransferase catalytic subunit [Dictyoglomus thermophilum]|uniref:Aspartate carbamoyltransferase n=1 Tax=Dictyoglomus thermophilum TaxID=14 RepID=A0A7C2GW39_DICTH|nr:aspartate carbamoyltransferase catalytic subunit [Dictyoglomus thermophilum]MCX7719799.1 aspartate carbamoyltransferase catalytic subunit [Dictyoglomus thermophilum]TYT22747.1 aspartate carbamoyltransferase catalytic subunit [Dictyoglomus thermophilum]